MSNSGSKKTAQPKSIDAVLSEFDGKKDLLTTFCSKTKTLIEECLDDAEIRYQSVQARVKSRKKLSEKYLDPQKKYTQLEDITDLAGLRVITYYEDEVDTVAELINREFEIDTQNTVDRRDGNTDGFGYHAINYVGRYSAQRLTSVEYKKFVGVCCEIQITSILRHAWAEIEHDWYDLKEAFPSEIKRRFYRMAALLEVAESEFLELRKKRKDYQRSIAVQIEANVSNIPLNVVSVAAFIEQDPLVSQIDNAIALVLKAPSVTSHPAQAEVTAQVANLLGLRTIEDLRSALKTYEAEIVQYSALSRPLLLRAENAPLAKGACIFRLGLMLLAKDDDAKLSRMIKDTGPAVNLPGVVDLQALGELARTVTSKKVTKR
jgi:putative GTP pyrophosphokinase